MLELLLFTVGVAVVGFLLLFFLVKAMIWLITIPLQLGWWLVKLLIGLIIGIPLAILAFVVCGVLLPVLATVVPIVLFVLAIPLVLVAVTVGFLKLVF